MSDFNGFSNGVTNYIHSCLSEKPWLDVVIQESRIILGEILKYEAVEWRSHNNDIYWEFIKGAFLGRLHKYLYDFVKFNILTSKQYLRDKEAYKYVFISELALFSLGKIHFSELAEGYWNDDLLDFQLIQKVYQEGK